MDFLSFLSGQLVARAYSLKERSRLFYYLRDLERTQWLPLGQLQDRQIYRLKKLLAHAYETVDYYHKIFLDAGFSPYDFHTLNQLANLPILTKLDITEHWNRMISSKYRIEDLRKSCTGGSTGTQLHFYINKESVDEKNACAWRHNRWAGWDLGIPVAALWGNPKQTATVKARIRRKMLHRTIYLDTMNMTAESMHAFADEITSLRDYVLYGHSHSIYLFADFLMNHNFSVPSPRGIVSTSMMLMENERQTIEEVFKTKVTDRYGCEEVSLIGSECEMHNGMHLNLDHLVIEFMKADGTQAGPGEEGKIVVTDLTNYGMPFIRYEVGDVGIPTDRRCSCGRGLPLMEKVIGRTADFLVRKDGSLVAGVSLIERFLTKISGIYQMQIVQNERDRLILRVVKGKSFAQETSVLPLNEEFNKAFPGMNMQLELVDRIPQERSGKYRFAICNIAS
jgi:phenylacetate-CoA ligase